MDIHGQSDSMVYHFDADLKPAKKENAVYTGIGVREKGRVKFTNYNNKTHMMSMRGYFTDASLEIKNGLFTYYDAEGFEISEGQYVLNKKEGQWVLWSNGHLSDSVFYEMDQPVIRISLSYYDNDSLSNRSLNNSRTNTIEIVSYDRNGKMERKTKWINGTGDQVYYYPDGKTKMIQKYENKQLIAVINYNPDGSEIKEKEEKTVKKQKEKNAEPENRTIPTGPPSYPGGPAGFSSFFSRNFKPPRNNSGLPSDVVTVTFYLDKAGFAKDIRVSGSPNRDLEIEIQTVFRRMSAWNMNGHQSYGPINYTINLSGY